MKKITVFMMLSLLSACTTPEERMAKCQAQGISRDTCYLAEQNRQNSLNTAAQNQALYNATYNAQKKHK